MAEMDDRNPPPIRSYYVLTTIKGGQVQPDGSIIVPTERTTWEPYERDGRGRPIGNFYRFVGQETVAA